jgi:hypothetical protein
LNKKKNIIVVLTIFFVVAIAGISGVGYLVCNPEILMNYFDNYHWASEKGLLRYLEKNYRITFPQSMTNVKAAELNTGFDGSSMFILKFQLSSDELNNFLTQFGEITESFKPYTPEADKRVGDEYPEWFKSPIETGQIGNVNTRGYNPTDIYIDKSNESEPVIYMEGIYRM